MSQLSNGQTAKVLITFTMTDGTEVPTSPDGTPLEIVVGQPCGFKPVDDALTQMSVGDVKEMNLTPEEGFGMPNPALRFEVPVGNIQGEGQLVAGTAIQMQSEDGQPMTAIIHEVTDTVVRVDANHPLAGEHLVCKIEVVGVA